MVRAMTCIMCPMGCDLTVKTGADAGAEKILVTGNTCPKGKKYAVQEMTDPQRNIATSVLVKGRDPEAVAGGFGFCRTGCD